MASMEELKVKTADRKENLDDLQDFWELIE